MLEFFTERSKTQRMCDKAGDAYLSSIKYVSECNMTKEMCNKAVNRFFLYLILFRIDIKLKKCVTELFLS